MDHPTPPPVRDAIAPPPDPTPGRWGAALVLALCLLPIWVGLGSPPMSGRSDGRYAAASRTMAESGRWLMPEIDGRPHLTKPPLTYWAEAAAMKALGPSEFAARLPSALAGSLVILGVWWLGRRLYGHLAGLCAAAVLSVMPLHVVVSRLTLTDALLSLFWFMSIAGGLLSVLEPKRNRWPAILWTGVALGWLTKPLAPWGAVGILAVWLVLGRRWRELMRPRSLAGFVLSLVPVALWAYLVYRSTPDLAAVWEQEVLERAAGGGRHDEPIWYFPIVFLVTFFPVTTMLELPGLNVQWAKVKAALAAGTAEALLALGVVMPIVAFSIPQGKLATYILPAAAPAALLTGRMLSGWMTGRHDRPADGYTPPEVKGTLAIVTALVAVGGVAAGLVMLDGWMKLLPLPILLPAAAALWNWKVWSRGPQARRRGLAAAWITMALLWAGGYWAIGRLQQPYADDQLLAAIRQATPGVDEPILRTYGYRDYALAFYTGRDVPPVEQTDRVAALAGEHGQAFIIVALPERWQKLEAGAPEVTARFERLMVWHKWPSTEQLWVLRPRSGEAAP